MDPPEFPGGSKYVWIRWLWRYDRRRFLKYLKKDTIIKLENFMGSVHHHPVKHNAEVTDSMALHIIESVIPYWTDSTKRERRLDLFEEDYTRVSGER